MNIYSAIILFPFLAATSFSASGNVDISGGIKAGFYTTGDLVGPIFELDTRKKLFSRFNLGLSLYYLHWKQKDPETVVRTFNGYDLQAYGLNFQPEVELLKFGIGSSRNALGVGGGGGINKRFHEDEFWAFSSPTPEPERADYIRGLLVGDDTFYDYGKIDGMYHYAAYTVVDEWVWNWSTAVFYKLQFTKLSWGLDFGLKVYEDKIMLWSAGLKCGYRVF